MSSLDNINTGKTSTPTKLSIGDLTNISESKLKLIYTNDQEHLKLKAGIFGKIFGFTDNTAIHIAGFIAITLVICGIFLCGISIFSNKNCENYWTFAAPLITSCLGYIFGKIS